MNEPLSVATQKNRRNPVWRARHGFDNVAAPADDRVWVYRTYERHGDRIVLVNTRIDA